MEWQTMIFLVDVLSLLRLGYLDSGSPRLPAAPDD